MAIIDHTFFVGDLNIPQVNTLSIQERLTYLIIDKEDKFLQDILGYKLWKAFTDGLSADPVAAKWNELLSGKEYTALDGYTYKWQGMKYEKTASPITVKRSLIANYVYWHWQKMNVSHSTGVGEAVANAENATPITPKSKMIHAWNEMIQWICDMVKFLDANIQTYPEWESKNNFFQMRNYRKQNFLDI